jgi:3-methyl-2-oxobutanoate hydroxymethyltransferase
VKLSLPALREMKREQRPIVMITAYDHPSGRIVDAAGVDLVLVGDSAANVVLGHSTTVPATMDEMTMLTRAVSRGVERALLIGDLPFMSYQVSDAEAVANGGRLIKDGGADAVKLEGAGPSLERMRALVAAGIPVMGHLGLTPQSVHVMGGYRVQGQQEEAARGLVDDAMALAGAGCFAIVLECVPREVAAAVTAAVPVPTIGIGAGPDCDGQVLVFHDVVGLEDRVLPKFVRRYGSLKADAVAAVSAYAADVRAGRFPADEESYHLAADVAAALGQPFGSRESGSSGASGASGAAGARTA